MKLIYVAIALIIAVIAGTVMVVALSDDDTADGDQLKVAATIYPLYDMTKEIAGDQFEVILMLAPGASPHTFDPQPSLVKDLEGSQTVFAIGNGLDSWSDSLTESIGAELVTVDSGVELMKNDEEAGHSDEDGHEDEDEHGDEDEDHADEDDHGDEDDHEDETDTDDHEGEDDHDETEGIADEDHEDEENHADEAGEAGHADEDDHEEEEGHKDEDDGHGHGPLDPHYWLSIHNASAIVMTVAAELGELDRENATLYMDRAQAYTEELEALETELESKFTGVADRNVISLHDAWGYFAADFDLTIVGTFEPAAGEEPTPKYLENLQEEIEEHNVSTLFVEPQLSTSSISTFAQDNDLNLAVIDPLGGVDGRNSYLELMRYNVDQVVSALAN